MCASTIRLSSPRPKGQVRKSIIAVEALHDINDFLPFVRDSSKQFHISVASVLAILPQLKHAPNNVLVTADIAQHHQFSSRITELSSSLDIRM